MQPSLLTCITIIRNMPLKIINTAKLIELNFIIEKNEFHIVKSVELHFSEWKISLNHANVSKTVLIAEKYVLYVHAIAFTQLCVSIKFFKECVNV